MKNLLIVIGSAIGLFLLLAIITATPLVGEVVTLHTLADGGQWQTTPLWVVDFDDASYLRAGSGAASGWVLRLRAHPEAKLERGGELLEVHLIEEPARRDAVHREMAEKYGWADSFVALMSGDRAKSIPLRIEVAD